jgi:hypothetical protein
MMGECKRVGIAAKAAYQTRITMLQAKVQEYLDSEARLIRGF